MIRKEEFELSLLPVASASFLRKIFPRDGEGSGDGSSGSGDKKSDEGASSVTADGVRAMIKESLGEFSKTLGIEKITSSIATLTDEVKSGRKGSQINNKPDESGASKTDDKTIPPEINDQMVDLNRKVKALQAQVDTEKAEKEKFEKQLQEESMNSEIRKVVDGHEFITESAKETAFLLVKPLIRKGDDGKLIAGETHQPRSAKAFVKDFLEKSHAYLLKDGSPGGAGLSSGAGGGAGVTVTTESIKPGMKKEDRDAAVISIQKALRSPAA